MSCRPTWLLLLPNKPTNKPNTTRRRPLRNPTLALPGSCLAKHSSLLDQLSTYLCYGVLRMPGRLICGGTLKPNNFDVQSMQKLDHTFSHVDGRSNNNLLKKCAQSIKMLCLHPMFLYPAGIYFSLVCKLFSFLSKPRNNCLRCHCCSSGRWCVTWTEEF